MSLLDKAHDPDLLAAELEGMAYGMAQAFKVDRRLRADAIQTMVLAGLEALKEYGEDAEAIVRNRMKSRLINFFKKEGRGQPLIPHTPDDILAAQEEERVVEKVTAEAFVTRNIWENPNITEHQKQVMRTLMETGFDRALAGRKLGMSMHSVTTVLARVRAILLNQPVTADN